MGLPSPPPTLALDCYGHESVDRTGGDAQPVDRLFCPASGTGHFVVRSWERSQIPSRGDLRHDRADPAAPAAPRRALGHRGDRRPGIRAPCRRRRHLRGVDAHRRLRPRLTRRRSEPGTPARAALPGRLPLGRRDLRVPDRGRRQGGRPGRVHLGHVQPHARPHPQRRHRRRRGRPLPPLGERPRPDEGPGATQLPVQHLVAAGAGRWHRQGQPARARLLPAAGRRPARARHRADGDAVPLGPAAGAAGHRRLGEPGRRVPVRRLRRVGVRGPRRRRCRTG